MDITFISSLEKEIEQIYLFLKTKTLTIFLGYKEELKKQAETPRAGKVLKNCTANELRKILTHFVNTLARITKDAPILEEMDYNYFTNNQIQAINLIYFIRLLIYLRTRTGTEAYIVHNN